MMMMMMMMIIIIISIRPHRSTTGTYIDAAYCGRWSNLHGLSVRLSVTIVSPVKTAEPIDMPFGLWTQWAKGSTVRLDLDTPYEVTILMRKGMAHCKV